jgi:Tol biopolymer transport system component
MGLDGTTIARLTSQDASRDAVWSPDGARIAYAEGFGRDLRTMVMGSDGDGPEQLADAFEGWTLPIGWNAAGSHLLLQGFGGSGCMLLDVALSGGTTTLLTGSTSGGSAQGDPCVGSTAWLAGG